MEIERKLPGRSSANTELSFGLLKAPKIKVFRTTEDKDPELAEFTGRAGPHGGTLEVRYRDEVEKDDPFLGLPEESVVAADERGEISVGTPIDEAESSAERVKYTVEIRDGVEYEIAPEEIQRGLWLGAEGEEVFVSCEDQLEAIEEETAMESMAVESFVRMSQLPHERIAASYFIAPEDKYGVKVCGLLYRALRQTDSGAIVRWTSRSRQSLGIITARPQMGLLLHKVVWVEKARLVPEEASRVAARGLKFSDAEIEATVALIEQMSEDGPAQLDELRDPAVTLREELHEKASAGQPEKFKLQKKPESPIEDLADALRSAAS